MHEDTERTTIVGPLTGLRVLDLGQVWAGPLLGLYLADFGAQVIKVESVARNAIQGGARPTPPATDPSAYDSLVRNRLSVSLNLTNPAGQEMFHRLVEVSDVLFENFSPRGARKLGLDYAILREINPRLIMASLSAAGQTGPWSDVMTYGPSLTALYGIKSLLGYPGDTAIQEDVADLDPTAATYALVAILAALEARDVSGVGQFIDMAQGEAGAAAMAEAFIEYEMNGRIMGPMGNRHRTMAPHGVYQTAGNDKWIAIAVDSEHSWRALCSILNATELQSEARFADTYGRLQNVEELDARLSALTGSWDAEQLSDDLQAAGVASYPVIAPLQTFTDQQLAFRREHALVDVEGVTAGQVFTATPWLLSASPPHIYASPRPVGADNAFVFKDVLDLTEKEISAIQAAGGLT